MKLSNFNIDEKIKWYHVVFGGLGTLGGILSREEYNNPKLEHYLNSYGSDVFTPFGLYFITRGYASKKATLFTWGTIVTLSELTDLGPGAGVFDPKDFLAYAAGFSLALGIEKIFEPKKRVTKTLINSIKPL
ncbi:hypothetical protein J4467_01835 [Candidatus Woesearchaeota archaeon]|nr:hypothetical protein [Candidatus Woesearchaeota archaeon]